MKGTFSLFSVSSCSSVCIPVESVPAGEEATFGLRPRGLQFGPGEDFDRRLVLGLAESEVVMKIEGPVTIERFAHDGTRHLCMAIGGKGGVRRVNEPGENGAIIQAKAGATGEGENGEIRCGGAYDHRSETDGWPAHIKVQVDAGGEHDFAQIKGSGHIKA